MALNYTHCIRKHEHTSAALYLSFESKHVAGIAALILRNKPCYGETQFLDSNSLRSAFNLTSSHANSQHLSNILGKTPFSGANIGIWGENKSDAIRAYGEILNDINETVLSDLDTCCLTTAGRGFRDSDFTTLQQTANPQYVVGNSHSFAIAYEQGMQSLCTTITNSAKIQFNKDSLDGVHISLQGLGRDGLRILKYLSAQNAQIIASETNPKIAEQVASQYPNIRVLKPKNAQHIYTLPCNMFVPCGPSFGITPDITSTQCKVIVGTAQAPLNSRNTETVLSAKNILYVPDYASLSFKSIAAEHEYRERHDFIPPLMSDTLARLHTYPTHLSTVMRTFLLSDNSMTQLLFSDFLRPYAK